MVEVFGFLIVLILLGLFAVAVMGGLVIVLFLAVAVLSPIVAVVRAVRGN